MDVALLVARVLLALVFSVAAAAKLADRAGSQQGLRDVGLPDLWASPAGVLLPIVELGVAWWGAVGATALLTIFSAGPCFVVNGSPSGVPIDADRRIATPVGVGATGIWDLVGGPPIPPERDARYVPAPGA
jgi:hypothetical protein